MRFFVLKIVAAGIVVMTWQTAAEAAYPDCPSGSAGLADWRSAAVADLQSGWSRQRKISGIIDQCFSGTLPKCLERLKSYSSQFVAGSTGGGSSAPEERQPPKELQVPGSSPPSYMLPTNIEDIAKEKGWLTARYKSRHSGGFDSDTSSLLMVYIPGQSFNPPLAYDRWMNFPLPADSGDDELNPTPQAKLPSVADYSAATGYDPYPSTMTMLSLHRGTATTAATYQYQMFSRRRGPGFIPNSSSGNTVCGETCHPNGLRAISPLGYHVRAGESQLAKENWLNVEKINKAMVDATAGRLLNWGAENANPKHRWPIYGPKAPVNKVSRTKEFILGGTLNGQTYAGCYQSRRQVYVTDIFYRPPGVNNVYQLSSSARENINWQSIATYMNCEGCHNNKDRYSLTTSTSYSEIDFKILVDQSMPQGFHINPVTIGDPSVAPRDNLTPDERIALANCLLDEMKLERPLLKDWLQGDDCSG